MAKFLPRGFGFLARAPVLSPLQSRVLLGMLRAVERAIPSDPAIERHLESVQADCVIVTPLVTRGMGGVRQTDVVKAARAIPIPVGVAVTSWDHLTSKGLLRGDPDKVFLWNEAQKTEAAELHGIPPNRIVVTGAQLFDQWFNRAPNLSREAFLAGVGLPEGRPRGGVFQTVGRSRSGE